MEIVVCRQVRRWSRCFRRAWQVRRHKANLRMVYTEVNLVPSGGLSLESAAEYIRE
jgi:hypothetical protein